MKSSALILCLLTIALTGFSQQVSEVKSIKIKKENTFVKAAFDESEYKVVAFDKYGNPHEKAIKSFSIYYNDGKNNFKAPVIGNTFPEKTIKFLTKKQKLATKICLQNIVATNDDGHSETLPDLCDIVIFPDCKKVHK